jgi:hypothetical protein
MSLKITTTTTRSGKSLSDSLTTPIECPQCGHKMNPPLTQLKNDPTLTCPRGHRFKVQTGGSARKVADQLAKIDRQIDNLFKN